MKTMRTTNEERKEILKQKIKAAQVAGDEEEEEYLTNIYYTMEIENQTINVYEGGVVIFQSGKPNVPPY